MVKWKIWSECMNGFIRWVKWADGIYFVSPAYIEEFKAAHGITGDDGRITIEEQKERVSA